MPTTPPRVVALRQVSVAQAFATETELISSIQTGEHNECLLLWQTNQPTLVLPASNKWQQSQQLLSAFDSLDWHITSRRTGGSPVPQTKGIINISHIALWPKHTPYSIPNAYQEFCHKLANFFRVYGIATQVHATPNSYCDGDYNLNIAGRKVVGTAQRVMLKNGGDRIVLAQACLIIDQDLEALVAPVNVCYELTGHSERFTSQAHTCLFEHSEITPTIDEIYTQLTQAFSGH